MDPQSSSQKGTEEQPDGAAASSAATGPNQQTGAIPKSISFDKNVFEDSNADGNRRGGNGGVRDRSFFKSWKLPKIGRSRGGSLSGGATSRGGSSRGGHSQEIDFIQFPKEEEEDNREDSCVAVAEGGSSSAELRHQGSDETSDDILAKYRKKVSHSDSAPDSSASAPDVFDGAAAFSASRNENAEDEEADDRQIIDPKNVEASYAFQDAKRKLRMMLSEADLSPMATMPTRFVLRPSSSRVNGQDLIAENGPLSNDGASAAPRDSQENDLVWLLRVQLAEALILQDRGRVAQLHETLRCIELFDSDGCRKLIQSLRDDYRRRSPYLSYLVRSRQGLLTTISYQQRLLTRMECDQTVCSQYLIAVSMRFFLERREASLQRFVRQFIETSVADERVSLTERFLNSLWRQLEEDPSWALIANEEQMRLARLSVERSVISHIYRHAMYPNEEADVSRDEVLSSHIRRLAGVVTPNHRDLKIPRRYQYEQPWPSAQAEIRRLAAYKTPSEKAACVSRCSQIIMNLLSMSSGKSVPAADDFVPVMVFVLIMANPPSLLSTVQYVDSFYGARMQGEDLYWWMQFVGAIEFIKTMDYHQEN